MAWFTGQLAVLLLLAVLLGVLIGWLWWIYGWRARVEGDHDTLALVEQELARARQEAVAARAAAEQREVAFGALTDELAALREAATARADEAAAGAAAAAVADDDVEAGVPGTTAPPSELAWRAADAQEPLAGAEIEVERGPSKDDLRRALRVVRTDMAARDHELAQLRHALVARDIELALLRGDAEPSPADAEADAGAGPLADQTPAGREAESSAVATTEEEPPTDHHAGGVADAGASSGRDAGDAEADALTALADDIAAHEARAGETAPAAALLDPTDEADDVHDTSGTGAPDTRPAVQHALGLVEADGSVAPDDLTRVEGVGPKMAAALRSAGIDSFVVLAAAEEDDLRAALDAAGLRFAPTLPTWPAQAVHLAEGDDEGLRALHDRLAAAPEVR